MLLTIQSASLTSFWYLVLLLMLMAVIKSSWFKNKAGRVVFNFSAKVSLDKIRYRFTKIYTLTTDGGTAQINDKIFVLYRGVLVKNKEIKGVGVAVFSMKVFWYFQRSPFGRGKLKSVSTWQSILSFR